ARSPRRLLRRNGQMGSHAAVAARVREGTAQGITVRDAPEATGKVESRPSWPRLHTPYRGTSELRIGDQSSRLQVSRARRRSSLLIITRASRLSGCARAT